MDRSFEGVVRIGIVYHMIFPEIADGKGPIIETASKIINNPFFTSMEVTWVKDASVKKELIQLLRSTHMEVIYGAAAPLLMEGYSLIDEDEEKRKDAIEKAKYYIDDAYLYNAKVLEVVSDSDPGEEKREEAKERLVDSLKKLCQYAKEKAKNKPLVISVETFDRTIDKKFLIGPVDEAVEIVKKVRKEYDNLGLTIDLSHLPLIGESNRKTLYTAKDYIAHIHMGNCVVKNLSTPLYGDKHPRFGVEDGETDIEELAQFLSVLAEIGYFQRSFSTELPVVSFEVKPAEGENSETIIADCEMVFREAWAKAAGKC